MKFIGDIHGDFAFYKKFTENNSGPSIQVGDFGIGFGDDWWIDDNHHRLANENHFFIRGNHDDPSKCQRKANYLGDWGEWFYDIFFVSGAYSIDKNIRTPGYDWWPDEELSYEQFDKIYEPYQFTKPEIMVTHDCPMMVYNYIHRDRNLPFILSRTSTEFDRMFEAYQPRVWVFGHHHKSFDEVIEGTRFVCVGINEVKEL